MKKVKEEISAPPSFVEVPTLPEKPIVGRLDLDFGREDLNKLRDKVNEIIDSL